MDIRTAHIRVAGVAERQHARPSLGQCKIDSVNRRANPKISGIAAEGAGILLYEQQEGRGIGLMAKLKAYELQDQGMDTVEANVELGYAPDCRAYELPAEVLKLLGVKAVRLMTNNPDKVAALQSAGIEVTERVSAEVESQDTFERYLRTKQEKMGHIFESVGEFDTLG